MCKLPSLSGKEAVKVLQKMGFDVARQSGSHVILKKNEHPNNISVPCHSNKSLKPGTLRGIIRAAGITVDEFLEAM